MSAKGTRHIRTLEIIQCNELLKLHLEVVVPQSRNEHGVLVTQGLVKYKPGFDDEQIAKQIASDLPPKSVAGVRIKAFGNLTAPAGSTSDNEVIQSLALRLSAAETKMDDMMSAISRLSSAIVVLTDRHDRLCETLAVNQVAPVRHLTTRSAATKVA